MLNAIRSMSIALIAVGCGGSDLVHRSAHPGAVYELLRSRETISENADGRSHGSSSDVDVLIERVIAVRSDGLELQYELPADATANDRAANWQLPARIFRPDHGAPILLDLAELETRVDPWLKAGGMTRTACGHLIFTWNAFRIDCDPQAVLTVVALFDVGREPLHAGDPFKDELALTPAPLGPTGGNSNDLVARMMVDPEAIRRRDAQTDVGVAEISGKPITLGAALSARATETVTGTITTTFHDDPRRDVRRRRTVTRLTTARPGTAVRTETITSVVQRSPLPAI